MSRNKGHRETSKRRILEAARGLFLKNGFKATSIRKIASEIGISPTTIYLYYQDKAEIMHALHHEGFKLLTEQFKTLQNVEAPFERLKAMGRCYINFAIENRDYYEIMFIMKEPLDHIENAIDAQLGCNDPEWEEGETAFHALIQNVEACQQAGYFKGYDTKMLSLLIWANMHGLCTLKNNGHLELITHKTIAEGLDVSEVLHNSFEVYAEMLKNI